MSNFFKNEKRGFTFIEIVVALGILVMLSGFVITSISAISQARVKSMSQTLKSEFEITRDFAKTHGGQAHLLIKKMPYGASLERTGENLVSEIHELRDGNLSIFYKETGDDVEYELGINDADDVQDGTLHITFTQTTGEVIGPQMLDYIIVSNESKVYKLLIEQKTGMMYYDYELEDGMDENELNSRTISVGIPCFIVGTGTSDTVALTPTGQAIQPEIRYDSRYVKIGGEYRAIDSGTYTITFTLKDPYTTQWSDGTTEQKILVWSIN